MNIKLSISYKLVTLVLFSIILSLGVAAFSFDYYIRAIFVDENKQNIVDSFKNTATEFRKAEREALDSCDILSSNEVVQATIRLVNKYEDKNNYNNNLLNQPKKDLADLLLKYIELSKHNSIRVYDLNGYLIAFAKYIIDLKSYQLGIVSYKNGDPIIHTKLKNDNLWKETIVSLDTIQDIKHDALYYEIEQDLLKLNVHSDIKLNNSKYIGAVDVLKILTKKDIQKLSSSNNISLSLSNNAYLQIKGSEKFSSSMLFSNLTTDNISILEDEAYFKSYTVLSTVKKELIYIKALVNKEHLTKALNNSRMTLLSIVLFAALFIGLFSLLLIRKFITTPIQAIISNIKNVNDSKQIAIKSNDELGEISKSFGEMMDLIKQREVQLIQSKNNLKQAQSVAKLGSWELDNKNNIMICSDEMYGILKRDISDNIDSFDRFKNYIHKKDKENFEIKFNKSVKEHISFELEYRIVRENKAVGYIQSKAIHQYDKSNNHIRSIGTFLDITQIRELEESNMQKDKLLAQQSKMAAMGEMLENIAHQWRQPLSVISTAASGIKMQKELDLMNPLREIELLDSINDSTKYLSKTIDDFRDFFKPNKDKNLFKLKNAYKKTASLLESKFKNRSIEVVEHTEDIEIYALEGELIQVIMILLNNARDVLETKPREHRKLIFVDIYSNNSDAVIEIKDSGGGIPEDIISKIFEPYFTTKHKSQGTGIGLYMSEEIIVKHMNGRMAVHNEQYEYDGKTYTGACFKITLPIKNS